MVYREKYPSSLVRNYNKIINVLDPTCEQTKCLPCLDSENDCRDAHPTFSARLLPALVIDGQKGNMFRILIFFP